MSGIDESIRDIMTSLYAFFGKRDCRKRMMRWVDAYVPAEPHGELLSKFECFFGEEASLFGIDESNVKELAEAMAGSQYRNEAFVKSSFVSKVLQPKKETVGYEFPVGENRADLCAIGRHSTAYEIKTAYDTLNRLQRQLNSYMRAFEYVYVVCDEGKLDDVLLSVPECVGVYSYSDSSRVLNFKLRRKAKRSDFLDETLQRSVFPSTLKTAKDVNAAFKESVRKKYSKSWDFLQTNMGHISMLDYQASFKLCRCF